MGAIISQFQNIQESRRETIRERRVSGSMLISLVLEEDYTNYNDVATTSISQRDTKHQPSPTEKYKAATFGEHILPSTPRNKPGNTTFFGSHT
tara:strand:- start:451 stop:729 length:279 start_codon:yes stop_codon:yes gene_type:complete